MNRIAHFLPLLGLCLLCLLGEGLRAQETSSLQMLNENEAEQGSVFLAFSSLDPSLSLEDARLFVNGEAVLSGLQRDEWLLTWTGELDPGVYTLSVEVPSAAQLDSRNFLFSVREKEKTLKTYEASAWQEAASNRLWSRENSGEDLWQHRHRMEGRFRSRLGEGARSMDLKARVLLDGSDWMEDNLSTLSRVQLSASYSRYFLALGDRSPSYGELILQGTRVRGVALQYSSKRFALRTIVGRTKQAASYVTGSDSLSQGRRSQYQRDLRAISLRFGQQGSALFGGLTLLKVKDDPHSLTRAQIYDVQDEDSMSVAAPQDNVAIALGLKSSLFRGRLRSHHEAALSLRNTDIRGGALTEDDLDELSIEGLPDFSIYEKIIVINEYFTPLNIKDEWPSILAFKSNWDLHLPASHLQLSFRKVGSAYQSLGQPYLLSDQEEVRFQDQFRLLENQLFMNIQYSNLHDNLDHALDETVGTTTRRASALGCTWAPREKSYSIHGHLRVEQEENELKKILEDPEPTALAEAIDGRTFISSIGGFLPLPSLQEGARFEGNLRFSRHKDTVGSLDVDGDILRSDRSYESFAFQCQLHLLREELHLSPILTFSQRSYEDISISDQMRLGLGLDLRRVLAPARSLALQTRFYRETEDLDSKSTKKSLLDLRLQGRHALSEKLRLRGDLTYRADFADSEDNYFAFSLRLSQSF
jgi:hypothetical protein